MSSQYQCDDSDTVLSIVTVIVWTHQICYRAVVIRLRVAQSSRTLSVIKVGMGLGGGKYKFLPVEP